MYRLVFLFTLFVVVHCTTPQDLRNAILRANLSISYAINSGVIEAKGIQSNSEYSAERLRVLYSNHIYDSYTTQLKVLEINRNGARHVHVGQEIIENCTNTVPDILNRISLNGKNRLNLCIIGFLHKFKLNINEKIAQIKGQTYRVKIFDKQLELCPPIDEKCLDHELGKAEIVDLEARASIDAINQSLKSDYDANDINYEICGLRLKKETDDEFHKVNNDVYYCLFANLLQKQ